MPGMNSDDWLRAYGVEMTNEEMDCFQELIRDYEVELARIRNGDPQDNDDVE